MASLQNTFARIRKKKNAKEIFTHWFCFNNNQHSAT
jgi:hypothetical protein